MSDAEKQAVFDKAHRITLKLVNNTKYLYFDYIKGLYSQLLRYHLPDTQETVEGLKQGIADTYFGGFEPEFETMEQYDRWENLNPESLVEKKYK